MRAQLFDDSWEPWSADRQGELSSYLSLRHQVRYPDWNRIVRRAKEVLAPLETTIAQSLSRAGLAGDFSLGTVLGGVVGVQTCAAFMDYDACPHVVPANRPFHA